jgi:hypothetical protein
MTRSSCSVNMREVSHRRTSICPGRDIEDSLIVHSITSFDKSSEQSEGLAQSEVIPADLHLCATFTFWKLDRRRS